MRYVLRRAYPAAGLLLALVSFVASALGAEGARAGSVGPAGVGEASGTTGSCQGFLQRVKNVDVKLAVQQAKRHNEDVEKKKQRAVEKRDKEDANFCGVVEHNTCLSQGAGEESSSLSGRKLLSLDEAELAKHEEEAEKALDSEEEASCAKDRALLQRMLGSDERHSKSDERFSKLGGKLGVESVTSQKGVVNMQQDVHRLLAPQGPSGESSDGALESKVRELENKLKRKTQEHVKGIKALKTEKAKVRALQAFKVSPEGLNHDLGESLRSRSMQRAVSGLREASRSGSPESLCNLATECRSIIDVATDCKSQSGSEKEVSKSKGPETEASKAKASQGPTYGILRSPADFKNCMSEGGTWNCAKCDTDGTGKNGALPCSTLVGGVDANKEESRPGDQWKKIEEATNKHNFYTGKTVDGVNMGWGKHCDDTLSGGQYLHAGSWKLNYSCQRIVTTRREGITVNGETKPGSNEAKRFNVPHPYESGGLGNMLMMKPVNIDFIPFNMKHMWAEYKKIYSHGAEDVKKCILDVERPNDKIYEGRKTNPKWESQMKKFDGLERYHSGKHCRGNRCCKFAVRDCKRNHLSDYNKYVACANRCVGARNFKGLCEPTNAGGVTIMTKTVVAKLDDTELSTGWIGMKRLVPHKKGNVTLFDVHKVGRCIRCPLIAMSDFLKQTNYQHFGEPGSEVWETARHYGVISADGKKRAVFHSTKAGRATLDELSVFSSSCVAKAFDSAGKQKKEYMCPDKFPPNKDKCPKHRKDGSEAQFPWGKSSDGRNSAGTCQGAGGWKGQQKLDTRNDPEGSWKKACGKRVDKRSKIDLPGNNLKFKHNWNWRPGQIATEAFNEAVALM